MEILVTGGTGFLGRHLAGELLKRGHRVRVMGRDFSQADDLLSRGAMPVRADLRDTAEIEQACTGVEAVFHAGALSAAWGERDEFFSINVGGTQAIVHACRRRGVRRLIYISSPSVVFDGRDQYNLTEEAPYPDHFTSVYSLTKKLGEDIVNGAQGVETVIVRPKAMFGPGDNALLPGLIRVARQGRLPQIGSGRNLVDLTYIDNVVQALVRALDSADAVGNTYHITNDEHVALWPVIRTVVKKLNLPGHMRRVPLGLALLAARGMEAASMLTGKEPMLTTYTAAILARTQTYDISAAKRDLGYAPAVSVKQGIARTLATLQKPN